MAESRVGRTVAIAGRVEESGPPFAVKLPLLPGRAGKMHWAQLSV